MRVLLVSAIGAIVLGCVLIRGLRRRSSDRTTDYLSLLICLLGTFAGFALAFLGADMQRDASTRHRLLGLLDAEIRAAETMVGDVAPVLTNARDAPDSLMLRDWDRGPGLYQGRGSVTSTVPILEQLVRDGDLFVQLSDPMKVSIHRIIESSSLWEGHDFTPEDRLPDVRYSLTAKLLQLRFVSAAARLERSYLDGALTEEQHAKCFDDTSMAYAMRFADAFMLIWHDSWYGDPDL